MPGAATIEFLPTERLSPNNFNPNHMSDEAFAELVAEVRHLGRLPKPVVVRPKGVHQYSERLEHEKIMAAMLTSFRRRP